jgi:hypothetical protein
MATRKKAVTPAELIVKNIVDDISSYEDNLFAFKAELHVARQLVSSCEVDAKYLGWSDTAIKLMSSLHDIWHSLYVLERDLNELTN